MASMSLSLRWTWMPTLLNSLPRGSGGGLGWGLPWYPRQRGGLWGRPAAGDAKMVVSTRWRCAPGVAGSAYMGGEALKRLMRLLVPAALVVVLAATAPAGAVQQCYGELPVIEGSFGDDIIHGTAGDDVIQTYGGADLVYGYGGD